MHLCAIKDGLVEVRLKYADLMTAKTLFGTMREDEELYNKFQL